MARYKLFWLPVIIAVVMVLSACGQDAEPPPPPPDDTLTLPSPSPTPTATPPEMQTEPPAELNKRRYEFSLGITYKEFADKFIEDFDRHPTPPEWDGKTTQIVWPGFEINSGSDTIVFSFEVLPDNGELSNIIIVHEPIDRTRDGLMERSITVMSIKAWAMQVIDGSLTDDRAWDIVRELNSKISVIQNDICYEHDYPSPFTIYAINDVENNTIDASDTLSTTDDTIPCYIVTNTDIPIVDAPWEGWNVWISNMAVYRDNDAGELTFLFDFEPRIPSAQFQIKLYDENNVLLDYFFSEPVHKVYQIDAYYGDEIYPTELTYIIPQDIIEYIDYIEFGLIHADWLR